MGRRHLLERHGAGTLVKGANYAGVPEGNPKAKAGTKAAKTKTTKANAGKRTR